MNLSVARGPSGRLWRTPGMWRRGMSLRIDWKIFLERQVW